MLSGFCNLPVAVRLLFGANVKDTMLLAHVFAPDAVVTERGLLFKGIASVAIWHRDFEERHPACDFELIKLGKGRGRTVRVRLRLRGAFAASPLELSFLIEMRDHRIASIRVLGRFTRSCDPATARGAGAGERGARSRAAGASRARRGLR